MQNINERLSGVCPILPTPFCEDDTIDCGSLEREVNFLLDSGVSGIALFGNASEAFWPSPRLKSSRSQSLSCA